MQFFSQVVVERLPLFEDSGFWIDVKSELSAGDVKKLSLSALKHARQDKSGEEMQTVFDVDIEAAAFTKVAIYLVDWNVTGQDDKVVDISTPKKKLDALKAMTAPGYAEIERAIDAHAEAHQEKKVLPFSRS